MNTMKYVLAIVLLVGTISGSDAQSQEYTVIHVKGDIYNPKSERNLQRGDKLAEDAKLLFKSTDAIAAVLSNTQGRYIIQAKGNKAKASGNDLTYVLKTVLLPARGQLSTRGGEGKKDPLLFIDEMKYRRTAWVNDTLTYDVSDTVYPMDEDNYFYVTYQYQGQEIRKNLTHKGNKLIFYKPDFYSLNGAILNPETASQYTLYYYKGKKGKAEEITNIRLSPVTREEVSTILEAIPKDLPMVERKTIASDFINTMYGYFDAALLGW